jgi:UrcA family protein
MFLISVTRRRCWKIVGVLLVAYGGFAGVAAAEIDAAPPQQVVRFGDLNLRDSRGVAAVYGRLVWAARHVCAGEDSADHWVRQSAKPCIIQAVSRAIDSIGAPALTVYARAQPLFRARRTEMIAVSH